MNINEDKVKRELERSRKALNLMFSGGLSRRSRKAKKQRKIAMGPMSKVSVDTSDREDSQTMLNLKDKIAETLLNSFNELLNEGGRSSEKRTSDRQQRQDLETLERGVKKGKSRPHRQPRTPSNPTGSSGRHFVPTARNRNRIKAVEKAAERVFGKKQNTP